MLSLFAQAPVGGTAPSQSIETPRMGSWGIDTLGMDRNVRPGDDFFAYVNGTWAKNTPIPADRSSYGAFATLRDLSELRTRRLVEGYKVGNPATGGDPAKVAALYRGFMDEAKIEKFDSKPIQPRISAVCAVRTVVAQNTAFPKLAQIFQAADLETLKAWQAFHTADEAAPLLSKRFVDANTVKMILSGFDRYASLAITRFVFAMDRELTSGNY